MAEHVFQYRSFMQCLIDWSIHASSHWCHCSVLWLFNQVIMPNVPSYDMKSVLVKVSGELLFSMTFSTSPSTRATSYRSSMPVSQQFTPLISLYKSRQVKYGWLINIVLDHTTAHTVIGYWHRTVICLSVCDVVCCDCCVLWLNDTSYSKRYKGLWSAETTDYVLPRLRTKFAERGFSYAGPAAWNRLPESIRRTSSQAAFERQLKTFLFCDVFNIVV